MQLRQSRLNLVNILYQKIFYISGIAYSRYVLKHFDKTETFGNLHVKYSVCDKCDTIATIQSEPHQHYV